jgi:hypothetical protein
MISWWKKIEHGTPKHNKLKLSELRIYSWTSNPLLLIFMILILTLLFITIDFFTNIEIKYIEKLVHIGATEQY